jgi:hypothetical protein
MMPTRIAGPAGKLRAPAAEEAAGEAAGEEETAAEVTPEV